MDTFDGQNHEKKTPERSKNHKLIYTYLIGRLSGGQLTLYHILITVFRSTGTVQYITGYQSRNIPLVETVKP